VAGYRLLIKPSAAKEIDALGRKKDRRRIVSRINALASEPRPAGCEKLAGAKDRYRIRQGEFRVVYAVDDSTYTVEVIKVGHRREVYRGTHLTTRSTVPAGALLRSPGRPRRRAG
jgi:mRNA interferase RelE/StbE